HMAAGRMDLTTTLGEDITKAGPGRAQTRRHRMQMDHRARRPNDKGQCSGCGDTEHFVDDCPSSHPRTDRSRR
ncbi:Unknown protein, partial [Striga hermonthica]